MRLSKLFIVTSLLSMALVTPAMAQDDATVPPISFEDVSAKNLTDLGCGGYEKEVFHLVLGYVNKSWICTYQSGTQREDFFGDADSKFLHGFQFGGLYTPSFDWGLGMRTGACFEFYTSRSKWIRPFCNHFSEFDIYIPLHASYRFAFDDELALTLYGGIGFQWAVEGSYYKRVGTVWPGGWWWRRPVPVYINKRHEYGNGWPEKVNWQGELGFDFRFSDFALGFAYSFGFNDHHIQNTFDDGITYETARRSRQDKIQASIAFLF